MTKVTQSDVWPGVDGLCVLVCAQLVLVCLCGEGALHMFLQCVSQLSAYNVHFICRPPALPEEEEFATRAEKHFWFKAACETKRLLQDMS